MRKYLFQIVFVCGLVAVVGCSRKWNNPVDWTVAPEVPVLTFPTDNATSTSIDPLFKWNAAGGATSYTLQISTSNAFSSFVYNQSGLTDTCQTVSELDTVTIYYWRVSASNNYGTSDWSNIWQFKTTFCPDISIIWTSVPAGNFTMGSLPGDPNAASNEQPQHAVYLDDYLISKYEITNAQYKAFMDAGGYTNSAYWTADGWTWRNNNSITEPLYWTSGEYKSGMAFPNHPIVGISWYEAYAFCKWAGGHLPTEAQWEKAARGIIPSNYWPWGSTWDGSKCNSFMSYSAWPDTFGYTSPVGFFTTGASPYGVYDMAGNVEEWCNDWYDSTYYSAPGATANPTGPAIGVERVLRGGSWDGGDANCRTTYRLMYTPPYRGYRFGFRPAK